MYAAYMLRTTYYERGYMSAQVDVKRSGEEDVFVVNSGPVFHFKDVKIVGLPEDLAQQVMKYAPKTGEVYSAARITDRLEEGTKQLAEPTVVQKFAGEETRLDQATATATVTLLFK
jgi:outer membrane protein assembly factor BamA